MGQEPEEPEAPLPGAAAMAQGQPGAGVEPGEGVPESEHPEQVPPEQPVLLATGAEAMEEQQKNPELKDNSGTRP